MKKVLLIAMLCAAASNFAYAQEQVPEEQTGKKKEVVSDQYNRNGVSVVALTRGDSYDSIILESATSVPDKFDHNAIDLKYLRLNKSRGSASTDLSQLSANDVNEIAANSELGKSVVSYIFNRQADGTMDDHIMQERGMYNATDQDVIKARASLVGESHLAEDYDKLIKSSYVILFDVNNAYKKTTTDKKGKTSTTIYANATADVYKVSIDLDELWNTWVYDTDSEEQKASKRAAFDAMKFTLTPVTRANVSGSSSDSFGNTPTYEQAIQSAYENMWENLNKNIEEWQVRVYVNEIKPISSKIGKKESLSNGMRYRSYSFKENKKGELVSLKRGYVRAVNVVDNRHVATGSSEMSTFYQISGNHNIQPGWLLKESRDSKLGAALDFTAFGEDYLVLGLDFDYLIHQGKGMATLALIDAGYDFGTSDISVSAGIGEQFHILRPLTIMPYAYFRGEASTSGDFDLEYYMAGAGIKLGVQFAYPWQIYVKLGDEFDITSTYNNIMLGVGIRREF